MRHELKELHDFNSECNGLVETENSICFDFSWESGHEDYFRCEFVKQANKTWAGYRIRANCENGFVASKDSKIFVVNSKDEAISVIYKEFSEDTYFKQYLEAEE